MTPESRKLITTRTCSCIYRNIEFGAGHGGNAGRQDLSLVSGGRNVKYFMTLVSVYPPGFASSVGLVADIC